MPMQNIQGFYILGLPIETEIGECSFLKVKEYPDYSLHLHVLSLGKDQILNDMLPTPKIIETLTSEEQKAIEVIRQVSLYELVFRSPDLLNIYAELFYKVFNSETAFISLNENNFDYYRKLLMDMNCVKEEKVNPNPEIQKWIEKSKRFKQKDGDQLEFADIVSSIVGYNGLTYNDINEMTLYQMYMTFRRIGQIKGYDTSTLFATVAEKVDVQSWCKHIDLFEEEKYGITREQFDNKANSLFGK